VPLEREGLRALAEEVGRFHVRDRKLGRAQARMAELLAAGGAVPDAEAAAYLAEVLRYFRGFEREARAHLRDLERRLARVSQVQFNLTAERGVAIRRVEATQGVLARIAELGSG
jgi:alpha-ketoglutarate-dependent taurine dioxygenase